MLGLFLGTARADHLRVGGSEYLGEPVQAALNSEAKNRGTTIKIEFSGSHPAWDRLQAGVLDLAVLMEGSGARSEKTDWVVLPLAQVSARVVVRQDLNVSQLSFADLAKIFSARSSVATPRWGDFGATGRWASVPVTANVVTSAGGLASEIFVHRALPSPELKSSVKRHVDLASALEAVLDDEGGIAVVPWRPDDGALKELLIASADDDVAFGPSPENLAAGDYPLALPLQLVFPRNTPQERLAWLQYWYGDDISNALIEAELSPLPRPARNQQIFELESLLSRN